MNNPVKVMLGSVVGAGIGVAITRALERDNSAAVDAGAPQESLRERWERAKLAGEAARAEKEAELKAYFSRKVDDPAALRDEGTVS